MAIYLVTCDWSIKKVAFINWNHLNKKKQKNIYVHPDIANHKDSG